MTPRFAGRARPIYRPIRSPKEFEETVNELDFLADMDPKEGTAEYDRMELLGILIAAYEEAHLPQREPATSQALVQFLAEHGGIRAGHPASGIALAFAEFKADMRAAFREQRRWMFLFWVLTEVALVAAEIL